MRTPLLALLTAGILSMLQLSCRKKELWEMENTGNVPLSCSNGTYDWNELDLDCGGECEPCAPGSLDAPCTPNDNSMIVGSQTFTFGGANVDSSGSEYEMYAYGMQGDLYITLHNTPPAADKKIYYISSSASESNKATIYLSIGFSYYSATSGKIYTERVNGQTRVTFCNIAFYSSTFGNTTGTGRLTAN